MKQILKTVISMTLITALFVCRLSVYAGDDDDRLFGEGGGRGFGSNGNGRAGTIWDAYTVNVVEVFGIPVIRWEKKEKGTTPQEQEQSITQNNTFITQMQQEYGTASVNNAGVIKFLMPYDTYYVNECFGNQSQAISSNAIRSGNSVLIIAETIVSTYVRIYVIDNYVKYKTQAPITGLYKVSSVGSVSGEYDGTTPSGTPIFMNKDRINGNLYNTSYVFRSKGDVIEYAVGSFGSAMETWNYNTWSVRYPYYIEIECISADNVLANYQVIENNTTSRVGTVEANYGYIDTVTGDKILYENCTIINEQTNVYTNPVTGETQQYQDIQYDYLTRTYTLTKPDGTVMTVEYGENGVVIIEGDTIYNIYYIIMEDDREGQDPDPSLTGKFQRRQVMSRYQHRQASKSKYPVCF